MDAPPKMSASTLEAGFLKCKVSAGAALCLENMPIFSVLPTSFNDSDSFENGTWNQFPENFIHLYKSLGLSPHLLNIYRKFWVA